MLGAAPPSASANPAGPAASGGSDPASLVSYYAPKLGPAGAAGLVGGFGAENSTFDPTIVGDGRHALGLAQWNDRLPTLKAYAALHGGSASDPTIQKQFALVEMGLAGTPNDPGYGTERQAGQALQAAQTPQQATAAALMYERPRGWSQAHPENANGYSKRLALASALMGGQGGASGGAMAYAAPQNGAQPPWPAQRPQMAPGAGGQPAPTQMAQNAPMMGLSPQGYANVMTSQGVPDFAKRLATEAQMPQQVGIPGGGTGFAQPGQPQLGTRTAAQGVLPGSASAGPASATTFTGVGPQGVTSTQFGLPGAANGGGGAGLNALDPLAAKGRDLASRSAELGADTEAMGTYKTQGSDATAKLGQIASLRALGDGIESGVSAQVKNYFAQYGFSLDDKAGRLQAYKFMAQSLLPPDAGSDIRERIPALSADPATRNTIADYLQSQYQYAKQRGDIASDPAVGDPSARRRKIQGLPPPQSFGGTPAATPPAQGAPAPQGGVAPPAPQAPALKPTHIWTPEKGLVKQ